MPQTELETGNRKLETDLPDLAQDIVRRAMAGGATAAECVVRERDEFSTLEAEVCAEIDAVARQAHVVEDDVVVEIRARAGQDHF